jgi:hypothetical protein
MKKSCGINFIFSTFDSNHLKFLLLAISLLLPLTYSQFALSADVSRETNKVSAKCHVLLVDGNEAISLWSVQQKELETLKNNIVGKKIHIAKSKDRVKISQSFQCVLDDDEFKSSIARFLDSQTPR